MSKTKIAPALQWHIDQNRFTSEPTAMREDAPRMRAELRALLAVARAAKRFRLGRKPIQWSNDQFWAAMPVNCQSDSEKILHRALARLERASGGKP
jgi:hypothetical protein